MSRSLPRRFACRTLVPLLGIATFFSTALAARPAWDLLPPPSGSAILVHDSRRDRELWLDAGGIMAVPDAPVLEWQRIWRGTAPVGDFAVYDSTSDRIWIGTTSTLYAHVVAPGKLWYLGLSDALPAWTEVAYTGSAPFVGGFGYVFDPLRRRLLTFGGYLQNSGCMGCDVSDVNVLSFAGTPTWSVLAIGGSPPSGRFGSAMAYDPWRDRVLVYGGIVFGPGYFDETWTFPLTGSPTWTFLPPTFYVAQAREQQSAGHAALDPIGRRWMIFGGTGALGAYEDTWALDLSPSAPLDSAAWTPVATGPLDARPTIGPNIFLQRAQSRMVLARGDLWALSLDAAPAWSTIGGDSLGFSRKSFITFFDAVSRKVFAGLGNDDTLQVRLVDGSDAWTALPDHGPSGRFGASVGVDAVGRTALVFGGSTDRAPLSGDQFSELWSYGLDGGGWTKLTEAGGPSARTMALGVFDPSHRRFIIHGGRSNAFGHEIDRTDTRSYDAVSGAWAAVGGVGFGGRYGERGIYDPIRDRIVAFGGADSSSGFYTDVHVLPLGAAVGAWAVLSTSGTAPSIMAGAGYGWEPAGYSSYDPVGDRMIVVAPDGNTVGVWQLTLDATPTWSRLAPDWIPSSLSFTAAGAAFDAQAGRMLLMGGSPEPGLWALYLDETTPTTLSLVSADATPQRVELRWQTPDGRDLRVRVQRSAAGEAWRTLAEPVPAANGWITYVDHDVLAGATYGYRIAVAESDGDHYYGETSIVVPLASALTLVGARPNPSDGPLMVSFSLASGATARLELLDVAGRRVLARAVGTLGAGMHTLRLDDAGPRPPAGLYFLRLEQGSQSRTARVVITR